jgi:hypothetical protein
MALLLYVNRMVDVPVLESEQRRTHTRGDTELVADVLNIVDLITWTVVHRQVPCCRSGSVVQDPLPEEVKLHPAVPTALDQLQAVDVAFDRSG